MHGSASYKMVEGPSRQGKVPPLSPFPEDPSSYGRKIIGWRSVQATRGHTVNGSIDIKQGMMHHLTRNGNRSRRATIIHTRTRTRMKMTSICGISTVVQSHITICHTRSTKIPNWSTINPQNLLRPSNFQTLAIVGRPHEKAQWSCPIDFTKVFWIISYTEVRLNLSRMTRMATKRKKNTLTIFLWCHLTKRKKKAARVNMRMITNTN